MEAGAYTRTRTSKHTHAYTHECTHIHIHTHTHSQTQSRTHISEEQLLRAQRSRQHVYGIYSQQMDSKGIRFQTAHIQRTLFKAYWWHKRWRNKLFYGIAFEGRFERIRV